MTLPFYLRLDECSPDEEDLEPDEPDLLCDELLLVPDPELNDFEEDDLTWGALTALDEDELMPVFECTLLLLLTTFALLLYLLLSAPELILLELPVLLLYLLVPMLRLLLPADLFTFETLLRLLSVALFILGRLLTSFRVILEDDVSLRE